MENKKIAASFRLLIKEGGKVELDGFDGGQPLMGQLADAVKSMGVPVGAEIRVTVEPVRSRGRYAKWATMEPNGASKA